MDKYEGKYYLQYACPGTQYNIYADGVYVGDSPLGPFELALNNPYSYKPGGFLPGAGHGSTMRDKHSNLWHTATMRISMNHIFERRVGIWPAGFDADGELFCNQRYGDWPMAVEGGTMDPWKNPDWYLLSYKKLMKASSAEEGKGPELAADENVQTWWRAATEERGQWLSMDLGKVCDVHAVQVNFADDKIDIPVPGEIKGTTQARYIAENQAQYPTVKWNTKHQDYDFYHGYEKNDKEQGNYDFPFGFGLSYTSFTLSDEKLVENTEKHAVFEVTVKNTGERDGAEVVQLYVSYPENPVDRSIRNLKGFERVELASGESKKVRIKVNKYELGWYNEKENAFVQDFSYLAFISTDEQHINAVGIAF